MQRINRVPGKGMLAGQPSQPQEFESVCLGMGDHSAPWELSETGGKISEL